MGEAKRNAAKEPEMTAEKRAYWRKRLNDHLMASQRAAQDQFYRVLEVATTLGVDEKVLLAATEKYNEAFVILRVATMEGAHGQVTPNKA